MTREEVISIMYGCANVGLVIWLVVDILVVRLRRRS